MTISTPSSSQIFFRMSTSMPTTSPSSPSDSKGGKSGLVAMTSLPAFCTSSRVAAKAVREQRDRTRVRHSATIFFMGIPSFRCRSIGDNVTMNAEVTAVQAVKRELLT